MDTALDDPCDDPDLVRLLVLEAGRLMEDASPEFALALPAATEARRQRLSSLLETARTLHALMKAAAAYDDQSEGDENGCCTR